MPNLDDQQEKKDTLAIFLARLDELGAATGIDSDRGLAKAIGMSKSNLPVLRAKLEAGEGESAVLPKWWKKLKDAEAAAGIAPNLGIRSFARNEASGLQEPKGTYGVRRPVVAPANPPPPQSPTRADVESYVAAYLDAASQLPGGIAHAYLELIAAWPMEKIRRLIQHQNDG